MSFLTNLGNYIYDTFIPDSIKNEESDNNVKNENSKMPIFEHTEKEHIDTTEFNNKEVDSEKKPSKELQELYKNGQYDEVKKRIEKDFGKLSRAEQLSLKLIYEHSVKRFYELEANGKINKDASKEELINEFASIMYKSITDGSFNNVDDFINTVDQLNITLGKDFDKLPAEIQEEKILKIRKIIDTKQKEELKQIQNLPIEERKKAEDTINHKYDAIRKAKVLNISTTNSSEVALNSLTILKPHNLKEGADIILNTRSSKEEKTRIADKADYQFTKHIISTYKNLGEEIETNEIQEYTSTMVAAKSYNGVQEYQNRYKADRTNYEKIQEKLNKGEQLTEEEQNLIRTMQPEYYTATAKGIGSGVLSNNNMNNDQKVNFYQSYLADAKEFNDYQEVKNYIKNELNNNPNSTAIKNQIENIINNTENILKEEKTLKESEKNVHTKRTTNKNNRNIGDTQNNIKNSTDYSPVTFNNIETNNAETNNIEQKNIVKHLQEYNKKEENKPVKQKTLTPTILKNKIKTKGFSEAIKELDKKEAIELILQDQSLSYLKPRVAQMIKTSYNKKDLEDLITKCSNSTVLFIFSIIDNNEDFAYLKETRLKTKGFCSTTIDLIEKMENKNNDKKAII